MDLPPLYPHCMEARWYDYLAALTLLAPEPTPLIGYALGRVIDDNVYRGLNLRMVITLDLFLCRT